MAELGDRLWRLSRTGGRARPTRAFSRHAVSLACKGENAPASCRDEPSQARFRSFGDGVRTLPWAAYSGATDRIRTMMSDGDPYDAGKNLLEFYKPVQRDDKIGSFSFASRFWRDGSPRLTAYEYQGMTRSKCFRAGKPGRTHHLHLMSRDAWWGSTRPTDGENENECGLHSVSSAICNTGATGRAH